LKPGAFYLFEFQIRSPTQVQPGDVAETADLQAVIQHDADVAVVDRNGTDRAFARSPARRIVDTSLALQLILQSHR
jgi:hypothetical protein